jgi:hypothetical protein
MRKRPDSLRPREPGRAFDYWNSCIGFPQCAEGVLSTKAPRDGAFVASTGLPQESLTEEEARRRHPDCTYFPKFSIFDGTRSRRAMFVWRSREAVGEEEPIAVYWEASPSSGMNTA